MSETNVIKDAENKTLTMERVFDAPRGRVWRAWTTPEVLEQWWGPRGWETTVKEFDFRPGGAWLYGMKCVDKNQGDFYGQESWGKGIFEDINEPDPFAYQDNFADADGTINDEMPKMTITNKFVDMGNETKLVSRVVFESLEGYEATLKMGVVEGFSQQLDRLDETLATKEA